MKEIDRQEYLNNMKKIFKDSKEYINNYDINNEIFESFGFIDSSWHNDLCPSYSILSKDGQKNITIWFPNSETQDYDNEQFDNFSIDFHNGEEIFFVPSIDDVLSIIKSNQNELNDYLNN
jgi:hypothetical protein